MPLRFVLPVLSALLIGQALAADSTPSQPANADLTSVRAKITAAKYEDATTELRGLVMNHPDDADVHNLLGFSLRKSGKREEAWASYRRALQINPDHKGALEYQGELFAETNQPEKARENVARLRKLCPKGCPELAELEKVVAEKAAGKTN